MEASTNGSVLHGEAASSSPESREASNVIDFLEVVRNLKTTKRQGWVMRKLQGPESIADHMHRMALMALVSPQSTPGVDRDRCIKIALVHDVAEAIVGDLTPFCGVPKEEKSRREAAAMDSMCATLGPLGDEMRQLWEEYEQGTTEEAKLVKDFDKVEMILQAWEYEREQGMGLERFFKNTAGKFQTATGRAYAQEICARRAKWQDSPDKSRDIPVAEDHKGCSCFTSVPDARPARYPGL